MADIRPDLLSLVKAGIKSPVRGVIDPALNSKYTHMLSTFPAIDLRIRTPRAPAVGPKALRNRRGDIHSSLSITPSASARRNVRRTQRDPDFNSDGTHLDVPRSDGLNLSAAPAPSGEPDEIRAI